MKKHFIYLTALIFLGTGTFAQILFSNSLGNLSLQSYTSGNTVSLYTTVPGVFEVIKDNYPNNAGPVNNPNSPFHVPSVKNEGWAVTYNPIVNDTFLVSSSWLDDNTLTSNEWIITPTVSLGANMVLTWLAMSPDPAFADGYEVYGTNKTGTLTSADFTIGDRLFELLDGNTAGGGEKSVWTRRSIPLTAFSGQNLRFAFRNNSKDRYQLWLDDIEIRSAAFTKEAEMTSITTEKYFLTDSLQSITVNITSKGAATINTLILNYKYDNSPVNSQSFVVNGGLNFWQSENFTFPMQYKFSTAGYYPVKSWISSVDGTNDQNLSSDTITTYVTVQASSPPKNVMVEQFVSAYDGESPDAQEKLNALQSSSVIVVNIHDNDSLEETNSTLLLNDYRKNFATAMVDRSYQNDFSGNAINRPFYADRINQGLKKITPAGVDIINKTYITGTKTLTFTVKADFVGEVKGDYRLNAYLVERHVYGPGNDSTVNGYNQLSNYFNVPISPYYQQGYFSAPYNAWVLDAWRFKHQNVLVHSFDGSYGTNGEIPMNGGTQGQSFQKTFTLTVPTPTNGVYKFNSDNLYIIGFVTEYNADKYKRNILNVVSKKLTDNSEVVGIGENKNNPSLSVYPNPCGDFIILNKLKQGENYKIQFYNILGKCVYEKTLTKVNSTERIDLNRISTGIYIIKASSGKDVFQQKIVISGN